MSFVLGGITFYEPGDHTLITNPASIQGVMAYNGNALYRLDKSAFSLATHLHAGQTITPSVVQGTTGIIIRPSAPVCGYITLYSPVVQPTSDGTIYTRGTVPAIAWTKDCRVSIGSVSYGMYALTLNLTFGNQNGKGISKGWDIFASHARSKTKIEKIKEPEKLSKKVDGYTYIDSDGKADTGFLVDDLSLTGLPGIVNINTSGEADGYSLKSIIALQQSTIRNLIARVEALEAKIK